MIHSLKYEVEFSTGRKLAGDFDFKSGMTAITGRNESGKSMSLEMIRYLLFGSKALRGKASEYKKIKGEMAFALRSNPYTVSRNGSKAELYAQDVQIASGVKPVNEAIIRLFGYGLDVFDVANNCGQDEINRIGSMLPTERKALIDQTIGLNAIDVLVEEAGEELREVRANADAIERNLTKPVEPVKPENYKPAAVWRDEHTAMSARVQELNQLRGWLSQTRIAPEHPGGAPSSLPFAMLQAKQKLRNEALQKQKTLQIKIASIPEATLTQEEINKAVEVNEHNAAVKRRETLIAMNPPPQHTEEDIAALELATKAQWLEYEIERLDHVGHVVCPLCSSDFPYEHKAIDELKAEREALGSVRYELIGAFDATKAKVAIERWAAIQEELSQLPTDLLPSSHTAAELIRAQEALTKKQELANLKAELGLLDIPPDCSELLVKQHAWEEKEARFQKDLDAWNDYLSQLTVKRKRRDELEGCEEALVAIQQGMNASTSYDKDLLTFEQATAVYTKNLVAASALREQEHDYEQARKALKSLKVKIKSHLLPSLNRVASSLLSLMTDGQRNQIIIDDDFNITVDDQSLATLSGSGKAVANLAIRIGLGQVLTNKVFSVFMADEIDAAMDDVRAQATADCLQNLTSSIHQVIIVSHKTINAQHHIEVVNARSQSTVEADD